MSKHVLCLLVPKFLPLQTVSPLTECCPFFGMVFSQSLRRWHLLGCHQYEMHENATAAQPYIYQNHAWLSWATLICLMSCMSQHTPTATQPAPSLFCPWHRCQVHHWCQSCQIVFENILGIPRLLLICFNVQLHGFLCFSWPGFFRFLWTGQRMPQLKTHTKGS